MAQSLEYIDNKEDYRYLQANMAAMQSEVLNKKFIAVADSMAARFDKNTRYEIGAYCTHWSDGELGYRLYQANAIHEVGDAWDDDKWDKVALVSISGGGGAYQQWVRDYFNSQEKIGRINDIRTYAYGPRSVYTQAYSSASAFPTTGSVVYIYKANDTGKFYEWTGSAYAEMTSESEKWKSYFPDANNVDVLSVDVEYVDIHTGVAYLWENLTTTTGEFSRVTDVVPVSQIESLF